MWKWRTDDIPHPMTGLKPEDQAYISGNHLQRRVAGPSNANPSALPNAAGFSPNTSSAPTSLGPIAPRGGRGGGRGRGRVRKVLPGIKNPARASTRKRALAQKPEPPAIPRQYEKGGKFPEPDTQDLKEKVPGLMMPPGHHIAEPFVGNPFCLEVCDVKFGGLGCPFCNPNFANIFVWAEYIGRAAKDIPHP